MSSHEREDEPEDSPPVHVAKKMRIEKDQAAPEDDKHSATRRAGALKRVLSDRSGPNDSLKRSEVILLIQQTLEALGFTDLSEDLAQASGLQHNVPYIKEFTACILRGDLTRGMAMFESFAHSHVNDGSTSRIKVLIYEEQYLEVRTRSKANPAPCTHSTEGLDYCSIFYPVR